MLPTMAPIGLTLSRSIVKRPRLVFCSTEHAPQQKMEVANPGVLYSWRKISQTMGLL
jgi:hypothetical protein